MSVQIIGNYLGRDVSIGNGTWLTNWSREEFAGSIVLVRICKWNQERFLELVRILCEASVLAIVVAGDEAERAFSCLLDVLQVRETTNAREHIMTGIATSLDDDAEVFETFFYSTFPDEERFDEWKGYHILTIECSDFAEKIALLSKFIQRNEASN